MNSLDRMSYVPLYRQLVEDLTRKIDSGEFQPGDRLPSERELAESLKVSRITARQALKSLEQLGLIYREQGRGTFVAEPRLQGVEGFGSFTEYVVERGLKPSSRVIKLDVIEANEDLQNVLKLQPNGQVLHIVRIRLVDGTPLALQSAYLPYSLCPGLESEDLASESMFDILRKRYMVYPTWTEPEVCAAAASDMEARILGVEPGTPVLVVNAVTYSDRFEVIEQVHTVYRGSDFWLYLGRQAVGR